MNPRDIVIVGAGPAGATAANKLAEAGIGSVLLDDNAQAGGQIFRAGPNATSTVDLPGHDARGPALRAGLVRYAPRIDYRPGHEVIGLHAGPRVWARGGDGRVVEFTPRHLVIASGALEINVPVRGWTLPGVYGLGGLQILLKQAGVVPAGPVVLGGIGPLLYLVAAQMAAAGVAVAAVVDAAPPPTLAQLAGMARRPDLLARGLGYALALHRRGIPLLRRYAVVEITGTARADGVVVAPLDGAGRPQADGRRVLEAAIVGLGFGLRPNTELTQLAGCAHDYDPALGGWHPRRDANGETSVAGIFAIGDGAGIGGVDRALAEATIVADVLARRCGHSDLRLAAAAARARRRLPALSAFRRALAAWSAMPPAMFAAADADTVVCRCEDVTRGELDAALDAGLVLPRGLKMATRAGMGLCQGRTCAPAIQHLAALRTSGDVGDVPQPSVRLPLRPVPAAALGALAPSIFKEES